MAKKQMKASQLKDRQIIRATANRQVEQSPAFVSVYTNDTQLQMTPWDLRLVFGVVAEAPTPVNPKVLVKTLCEVRMSPQHAKKIASILLEQLKHYEENVGEIPQPR